MTRRLTTKRRPNRIGEIRQRLGLSFEAVAARIHDAKHTPATIEKLEIGEMGLTLDWMYKLAGALDCEPWDLIPGAPPSLSLTERQIIELTRQNQGGAALPVATPEPPLVPPPAASGRAPGVIPIDKARRAQPARVRAGRKRGRK